MMFVRTIDYTYSTCVRFRGKRTFSRQTHMCRSNTGFCRVQPLNRDGTPTRMLTRVRVSCVYYNTSMSYSCIHTGTCHMILETELRIFLQECETLTLELSITGLSTDGRRSSHDLLGSISSTASIVAEVLGAASADDGDGQLGRERKCGVTLCKKLGNFGACLYKPPPITPSYSYSILVLLHQNN